MRNTLKSFIAGLVVGFLLFSAAIPLLGWLGIKEFRIDKTPFWGGFTGGFGAGFGIIVGLLAINWVIGRIDKAASGM
ncbi:MAG: hypothetical protein KF784_03295 [Fimbriimonadaceae bacterium]|nr:hypothetical protein [Fimbriimonadaceae bacterium]